MGIYLRDNPPVRSQYRSPRRARPTGCTVLHTAESVLDTIGPDTGAENVAAFIRRRTTPGSYHDIVDSDSVIQLVDYGAEAYQDATGSNPFALSISFALAAADWPRLSPARRAGFLAQGARAFAAQQAWLRVSGYPLTPLVRITKAQSDAGVPGFITHALRDPARRTDPGKDFPWAEFFAACASAAGTILEGDDMTPEQDQLLRDVRDGVAALGGTRVEAGRAADAATAAEKWAGKAAEQATATWGAMPSLVAEVGALRAAVAALASGGTDPAVIRAAAEKGAADALANLTLVTKPN